MTDEITAFTNLQNNSDIIDAIEGINCGDIQYRIAITNDNDGGFIEWGGSPWFDSQEMSGAEIAAAFTSAAQGVLGNGSTAIGCEHVLQSSLSLLQSDATGFRRPGALLVLVLVSDVDDYAYYDMMGFGGVCDGFLCTEVAQPVANIHASFLEVVDDSPSALASIVIAGDPGQMEGFNTCQQPASCCGVGLGECSAAGPAPRLWSFAGMLAGGNGITGNICDGPGQIPMMLQEIFSTDIDMACRNHTP